MKQAVIDIGTNSTLLLIANTENKDNIKIIDQRFSVTRLGEGVHRTGVLSEKAMQRTWRVLYKYKEYLVKQGVEKIHVLGTQALRTAKNNAKFKSYLKNEFDWELGIISEAEEAQYSFTGALDTVAGSESNTMVVDVGGGSTEIIFGKDHENFQFISIPIGVVYLMEKFKKAEKLNEDEKQIIKDEFSLHLNKLHFAQFVNKNTNLIGVGGTITTLAAILEKMTKYDPEKINGYKIDLADLENIFNTLNKLNNLERKKLPGLVKGREDVILFGILIYWAIMVKFSFSVVIASDRGLRYGYLKWLEINKKI